MSELAELAGQRKVQIPSVGDVLVLDKPWTFRLFHEYRNETLLALFGQPDTMADRKGHTVVTLPRGTELRVDRIYIRKGVKDYDSLTFLAKGLRPKNNEPLPKVPPQPKLEHDLGPCPSYASWNSPDRKKADEWHAKYNELWKKHQQTKAFKDWRAARDAHERARRLRRPVRFWAKLVDVNKMVVRSANWTARDEAEPVFGQRAIELE